MRGTILGYDPASGEGVITSNGGERFKFARDAWKGAGDPIAGRTVDYELLGDRAADIYPIPGPAIPGFGGSDQAGQAMTYGIVSLVCALLTFVVGPLAIFTLPIAIVCGIKGKNEGALLADKTPYYLSIAGLALSGIALLILLVTLAACGAFVGLITLGGWWV